MEMIKQVAEQELFKSTDDDGTKWLFVVRRENGWAIRRNGAQVGEGSSEVPSLRAGVDKFIALTCEGIASKCGPVVQKHLDRIELKRDRTTNRKRAIGQGGMASGSLSAP